MKAFTVTAHSVTLGIRVHSDPFPHVSMGEPGDFQTSFWIPLDQQTWTSPPRRIIRCRPKLIPPKEGLTHPSLMLAANVPMSKEEALVEADRRRKSIYPYTILGDDDDALVLADIRGKPGGEAVWTSARTAPHICPLRNHNGGGYDQCPLCNTTYIDGRHPNEGKFKDYTRFPPPLIEVIKTGHIRYKADPDWGDMSKPPWGRIYLLRLKPRAIFRVHRGYDKGQANERFVRWTGEHMELGSAEEILDQRPLSQDESVAEDDERFDEATL